MVFYSISGYGLKSKTFARCKIKKANMTQTERFHKCLDEFQKMCEESPHIILKTIRMRLSSIKHFMSELPNLKIIHLVRDPRATLISQSKLGMCKEAKGGIYGCTDKVCSQIENDLIEEEKIREEYPDRIFTVFYNQIARHPVKLASQLMSFIGAEFTDNAQSYVFNITSAGRNDTCIICTTRSNSTEHIEHWKKTMPRSFIDIVQSRCNFLLRRYEFEIV